VGCGKVTHAYAQNARKSLFLCVTISPAVGDSAADDETERIGKEIMRDTILRAMLGTAIGMGLAMLPSSDFSFGSILSDILGLSMVFDFVIVGALVSISCGAFFRAESIEMRTEL